MEIYLLKSNTHFAASLGSRSGRLQSIPSKNKFTDVLGVFTDIESFLRVNLKGSGMSAGSCQLSTSLNNLPFSPVAVRLEAEKVEESNYRYKVSVGCHGKIYAQKILDCELPLCFRNMNPLQWESDLQKLYCKPEEKEMNERSLIPLQVEYNDRLITFTDPLGSGYYQTNVSIGYDQSSLAFMAVMNRIRYNLNSTDDKLNSRRFQLATHLYVLNSMFESSKSRINQLDKIKRDKGRDISLAEVSNIEKARSDLLQWSLTAKLLLRADSERASTLLRRYQNSKKLTQQRMFATISSYYDMLRQIADFSFEESKDNPSVLLNQFVRISKLEISPKDLNRIKNFITDICKTAHPLDRSVFNVLLQLGSRDMLDRCDRMREAASQHGMVNIWRAQGNVDSCMIKFANSLLGDQCSWVCTPKPNGSFVMKKTKFTCAIPIKNYMLTGYADQIEVFGQNDIHPRFCKNIIGIIEIYSFVGLDHSHKHVFVMAKDVDSQYYSTSLMKISIDSLLSEQSEPVVAKRVHHFGATIKTEIDINDEIITALTQVDSKNTLLIIRSDGEEDKLVRSARFIDLIEPIEDQSFMNEFDRNLNLPFGFANLVSNGNEVLIRFSYKPRTGEPKRDILAAFSLIMKKKPFIHQLNSSDPKQEIIGPVFRHKKTLMHFGLNTKTHLYSIVAFKNESFTTLVQYGKDTILRRRLQSRSKDEHNKISWKWIHGHNRLVCWCLDREEILDGGDQPERVDKKYRMVLRMKSFRLRL